MSKSVLVLCTGNGCRSQIAHGYLEHLTDNGKVKIFCAGVETHGGNPKAILTMQVDGIDISKHTSNNIDEYFDFIFIVCDHAKERCPYFPTRAKKFYYNFPDLAQAKGTDEEIKMEFRIVRQLIKAYCEEFVTENLMPNRQM